MPLFLRDNPPVREFCSLPGTIPIRSIKREHCSTGSCLTAGCAGLWKARSEFSFAQIMMHRQCRCDVMLAVESLGEWSRFKSGREWVANSLAVKRYTLSLLDSIELRLGSRKQNHLYWFLLDPIRLVDDECLLSTDAWQNFLVRRSQCHPPA
jgi:hypothetical protein